MSTTSYWLNNRTSVATGVSENNQQLKRVLITPNKMNYSAVVLTSKLVSMSFVRGF